MLSSISKVVKISGRYFYHKIYCAIFLDPVTNWSPSIVHAHDIHTLAAAANIARNVKGKYVFDSHELETHRNPPLGYLRRRQVEKMERNLLPKAAGVITVSQRIAEYLENTYNISRPLVLYNAPQAVPSLMPDRWNTNKFSNVRKYCGLNDNDILAVHTGNVSINRGLEILIVALGKRLTTSNREKVPIHLAMVGRCEPNFKISLTSLAEKSGVANYIHFVDSVAPSQVVTFISTADIAVIPIIPRTLSYNFAMPNKLFESAFADLVILASDLAEMGPFISANNLGYCFDPFSLEDIVLKLELAVNSLDKTRPDRDEFREAYCWERQGEKLIELYNEISISRLL